MSGESVDFVSDHIGKKQAYRQDWDVQQAFGVKNYGVIAQVKAALAAGYAVTPVYASTSAKSAQHSWCACPLGRRVGHVSGHPVSPGFTTTALSVVESITRAVGSAVGWKAVDDAGILHDLDDVLEEPPYTPSPLFAPLFATEHRLAAEADQQRQEAMKKK